MRRYSLTAAHFAPTDLTIELLYLVEAKSAVVGELRDLNLRLQGAKIAAEEQALTDTLTVQSLDGTTTTLSITINGANDLPMMGVAGLSVAYHAKPKVREQAMVAIEEGGLDRLLEVFATAQ